MKNILRGAILFCSLLFSLSVYAEVTEAQDVKYQLIGSFHNGDNISEDMYDNQYTFNSTGSVFFKIKDKENNIYYGGFLPEGASNGDNKNYTPLAGSYKASYSTDVDGVGSLYFTMNEGFRYTVIFQEPTEDSTEENFIISLKIDEIKEGNFDIEARSNESLTQGMFWPMVISEEGLENATITSISVTSWDYPFVNERFERVFYWVAPEGEKFYLKDWDRIIGEGVSVDDGGNSQNSESGHNWIIDETAYADDVYCYQLAVVMNVDGKSKRFVVNSDRFLINSSGEPLVIRAYYLVQKGMGSNEYYTLSDEQNPNVYSVTNLNGSLGNSGNILFTKANLEDEIIDFGNEEQFRFTDQILIRSNKPYGVDSHRIEKFSLYNVTDPENPVLLTDTETNGNAYNNDEGRFMSIVECQINTQDYKLVMVYRDENGNAQTLEALTSMAVTIPSPKIQESYVEFYKGSDNTETTDNSTFTFTYQPLSPMPNPFNLRNARYHNLRQYVKLIKPNTTEVLGQKMLDLQSGSFNYFYNCIKNDEIVNVVNLRFQSENSGDNHSVVWETYGPCVIPEELLVPEQEGNYDYRELAYTHNFPTAVYDRWGDGRLSQIEITDDAPVSNVPATVNESFFTYTPNNSGTFDLVENFKVKIKLNDEAVSNQVMCDNESLGDLLHKTDNDYYYVVIIDTTTDGIDLEGPTKPEYIASTGLRSYPEGIYTASQLNEGVEIEFSHVHARTNKKEWNEEVEKAMANPFSEQLQVRISYLYPFRTYGATESSIDELVTLSKGLQKKSVSSLSVPSNLHGNVIMSKPLIYDLEPDKITTRVNNIVTENPIQISSGKGYILVQGAQAEVYATDGREIFKGDGYIYVPAGIYIVCAGDEKQKVAVF